jgi:hypothetical protein
MLLSAICDITKQPSVQSSDIFDLLLVVVADIELTCNFYRDHECVVPVRHFIALPSSCIHSGLFLISQSFLYPREQPQSVSVFNKEGHHNVSVARGAVIKNI